ncbi:MAG TPA: response regulator [Bryobacteraceae bacterium]|jgi:CheY-like chemotaxis protein|nr:response regulator [Bryobacteraceae bacterium]
MSARILIIEDNEAAMDLMVYLLHTSGYRTFSAENGAEGLRLAKQELPDLIVCDINLPEMDGLEVLWLLKENSGARSIPIVAVTALAMVGDRERLLRAGFDGYISKPIDPEIFVAQMEALLRSARPNFGK